MKLKLKVRKGESCSPSPRSYEVDSLLIDDVIFTVLSILGPPCIAGVSGLRPLAILRG